MPGRYLVPQFLEIEPRIIGPVTIRQFLILMYAAFVDFIVWKLLSNTYQNTALGIMFVHTMLLVILAFAKVNGQSFHYFILNIVRTFKKPRLRIWTKLKVKSLPKEEPIEEKLINPTKPLPPKSHLSDLSLMVDTGGAYNVDVKASSKVTKVEEINI